jgi:hypothetical protein
MIQMMKLINMNLELLLKNQFLIKRFYKFYSNHINHSSDKR